MNFCVITSSYPSNPDDIVQAPFIIDFIKGLRKRGHSVFIFTQDREGTKEEFLEGVHVEWFPWMKSKRPLVHLNPLNPIDGLRIFDLLRQGKKHLPPFLKENKIDACLSLWVLPGGYFAYEAHRKTGIPYSVWALGSDIYRYGRNPLLYRKIKNILDGAKSVFADGFDLVKKMEERFKGKCSFLATTRIVLPPPELADKNETGKSGNLYRFLFVGRLEKVKGIDVLLESAAQLAAENPGFHLTVVGRGGMEPWAKEFVNQKNLTTKVAFKGNVPDEELTSLYAASNCVVIPSRSESIPLVFSEALAFNKEMIVTDVGDMGMLGRRYDVASVVPSEDPAALKSIMRERLESQDYSKKQDDLKREELKQLFNMETSVERFLSDYK